MATNEGEGGRRLNRMLQIVREEEEINRQLKGIQLSKHYQLLVFLCILPL